MIEEGSQKEEYLIGMIERGKWKEELDGKRSQEQDSYLKDLHLKDRIERFMAFKKRLIEGQIGDGRT